MFFEHSTKRFVRLGLGPHVAVYVSWQVVLVTKGGCKGQDKLWAAALHPKQVFANLRSSLARLGVSSLDMYDLSVVLQYEISLVNRT